ncbi:MAG: DUF5787 family protein [Haloquadratum sp.]|nr:DUF5787 family protein [Haloferacaceae archaeon]MDR9444958.1 DUF5787 family protein [Haloquadratum sp.]
MTTALRGQLPTHEFGFELLVCRWAELSWPPHRAAGGPVIVGRQLGEQARRWDTIVLECDPAGLRARAQFGDAALDRDLLFLVRNAPTEFTWYRDCLPDPGFPRRRLLPAIHRAAARGVLEVERRGRRVFMRQVAAYPPWVRRLIAIENKPDLDASAARRLGGQLAHDVERSLADEVWVATALAADAGVPAALIEPMPEGVGIIGIDAHPSTGVTGSVLWRPRRLRPASDDAPIRYRIAEAVYGQGWRSYASSLRTDCRHLEPRLVGQAILPWCAAKQTVPTPRGCRHACPKREPEPPQWRMQGWPLDGGPGKSLQRILEARRRRTRQS